MEFTLTIILCIESWSNSRLNEPLSFEKISELIGLESSIEISVNLHDFSTLTISATTAEYEKVLLYIEVELSDLILLVIFEVKTRKTIKN